MATQGWLPCLNVATSSHRGWGSPLASNQAKGVQHGSIAAMPSHSHELAVESGGGAAALRPSAAVLCAVSAMIVASRRKTSLRPRGAQSCRAARRPAISRRCLGGSGGSGQTDVLEKLAVSKVDAETLKKDALAGEQGENADEVADERILMVALVAMAYVIWQMDKVNMSVAILPMMKEYGWSTSQEGIIQSAIFWGYAATQIVGGFLATRFGGKRVLLGAVTLWSTATMLAPFAAEVSTEAFIVSRVLVGIGEGLAPSAGTRIVATWMPVEERSRAVSVLGSGKFGGAVLGLLAAPAVIEGAGWQAMFFSFGFLGLVWAATWAVLGQDKDEWDRERGLVTLEQQELADETPIPWLEILKTPALWAVVIAHFCNDWGAYALLTWTPQYLYQELGYNLKGSSELTLLPSVLAVGVAAMAGTAADSMLGNGMELTQVRKIMQTCGFVLPAICLSCLGTLGAVEPGSLLPVGLLVGGISFSAFSLPGLYASHSDLSARYAGLVNGISTTFGALAGICSNAYAGYVLESTGSWGQAIFLPSVACYAIGLLGYTALYDATPIDWDARAASSGGENKSNGK